MAFVSVRHTGEPLGEMNTTPLIDVMLVLLVMLIFTLPVATHSIDIDLPQASNVPTENIDPIKNKIVLTPQDQILWNGTPITDNQLVANLQQTLTFAVEPELQYEPESEASYDLAAKVLNINKASGVTKFGFVGNEKYREFGKG